MRLHLQRFCDVAFTVKLYCKCNVAKPLQIGPFGRVYFGVISGQEKVILYKPTDVRKKG